MAAVLKFFSRGSLGVLRRAISARGDQVQVNEYERSFSLGSRNESQHLVFGKCLVRIRSRRGLWGRRLRVSHHIAASGLSECRDAGRRAKCKPAVWSELELPTDPDCAALETPRLSFAALTMLKPAQVSNAPAR